MSISVMGSVNSYTKTMKLQTQWNLKQQSGDYNSHKKSLADWVNTARQDLEKSQRGLYQNDEEDSEAGKQKLNSIMMKIYAGKRLSQKERTYLQNKNPQAYQKLLSTEQEQKAYERRLRRCRTKEEVQRLKMTHLASSLATVNSVSNNPNIPTEKKLEICMQEKVRCDRLQSSTHDFVRSGEYDRLPSELDKAHARKKKKFIAHIKPPVKPEEPEKPELEMPKEQEMPELPGQNPNAPNAQNQPAAPNRPEAAETPAGQPRTIEEKARAAYAEPQMPRQPKVIIQA